MIEQQNNGIGKMNYEQIKIYQHQKKNYGQQ